MTARACCVTLAKIITMEDFNMNRIKKLFFLPLAFCLTLTLTGCNIFENQNHNGNPGNGGNSSSSETVIKYTASDIKYYTQAGEAICTNSSGKTTRTYYKAYDGFCAVALANIGDYFGPVLVGEDAAQVCFSQSYDSTIIGSGGSIIYDGVEYFYSRADYFLSGYLDGKEKYPNYFSKQTTLEEVAKEIASLATFEKVSDSLKKEFIFTELVDGTLSVKAGPYCQGKEEIVIPSTFEGKTVSKIESKSFQNLTKLKVLRFAPNSKIKKIGENAFLGCTNLKYAVIPQSVTKIGSWAFESCSSELMIYCEAETMPSGYYVDSYHENYWWGSADKVWYGMVDYIETDKYRLGVSIYDTILVCKYIGDKTSVTIPNEFEGKKVTQIGRYAFFGFNRVTDITLPSDLETIGSYAFANCAFLKEIRIPDRTTTIYESAFRGCSNLIFAFIPQSVTKIGSWAFESCSSELMIYCEAETMPSGYYVDSYHENYWWGSADKVWYGMVDYIETENYKFGVKIDGTLSISKYLGSDANVVIPENYNGKSITSIGGSAFEGKNRMKSVTLPSTLTRISSNAFENCSQLKEIHVPNKVTEIGYNAFRGCTNLKYAVIPQSVTQIGSWAFESCSSELMIYCEAETMPSGYYVDSYHENYWWGSADKVWYGTTDYVETENYQFGIKIDGSYIITKYLGSETDVFVPSEIDNTAVSEIGRYSFAGKNRITKLTISNTVYKIGNYAFNKCSFLNDVTLSPYLKEIGEYAFSSCSRLNQIVIPKIVTKIGNGAFNSCSSDLKIFCEVSSRPSGYYEYSWDQEYWYGSGKPYYAGQWAYDKNGNPYVKK